VVYKSRTLLGVNGRKWKMLRRKMITVVYKSRTLLGVNDRKWKMLRKKMSNSDLSFSDKTLDDFSSDLY
jgi:hypothetical protein